MRAKMIAREYEMKRSKTDVTIAKASQMLENRKPRVS